MHDFSFAVGSQCRIPREAAINLSNNGRVARVAGCVGRCEACDVGVAVCSCLDFVFQEEMEVPCAHGHDAAPGDVGASPSSAAPSREAGSLRVAVGSWGGPGESSRNALNAEQQCTV